MFWSEKKQKNEEDYNESRKRSASIAIQLLIDHKDELALDPRLTYDLIKDELDYDAISVTNDEFVWFRYVVPVLVKHGVKVFARH